MKNIAISLLAAITLATPAYAISWKEKLWTSLDIDQSGEVSYGELTAGGCPTDLKYFKIADADRSGGLNKAEYFNNRDLLGRCK